MTVARRILQNRALSRGSPQGATIRRVLWIYDCPGCGHRLACVWSLHDRADCPADRDAGGSASAARTRTLPSPRGPRIVVHAVSAGEMTAAGRSSKAGGGASGLDGRPHVRHSRRRALADALRARLPSIEAAISLPWDRRRALGRWLHALGCSAVVVVEPEIWPNLYDACGRHEVPLLLVNGHIYPRDVARYRLAKPFFRPGSPAAPVDRRAVGRRARTIRGDRRAGGTHNGDRQSEVRRRRHRLESSLADRIKTAQAPARRSSAGAPTGSKSLCFSRRLHGCAHG